MSVENVFCRNPLSLSCLPYPDPHHGNDTGAEARDEREQYEHVAIVIICVESKQLETPVYPFSTG
jgi:hypothetical protein